MYDVTNRESFDSIRKWVREVDRYASQHCKLLVANKVRFRAAPLPGVLGVCPRCLCAVWGRAAQRWPARNRLLARLPTNPAPPHPSPTPLDSGTARPQSDREDRKVSVEEGEALAEELGMPFIETSAKSANNVKAAFVEMAKSLINTKEKEAEEGTEKKTVGGGIDPSAPVKRSGGCC